MTAQELFDENQAFAMWVANKFKGFDNFEDLKQLALIGLHRASLNFDETRGVRFATFANYYIRREIVRHLETWQTVHIPRQVVEQASAVKKLDYENMTVEQITAETGLTKKQIAKVLGYINLSIDPIDGPAYNAEDSITLGDTISLEEESWDDSILFKDFMKTLNKQEIDIVRMRLDGISQLEIGNALNTHQVSVSRALKRIKKKFDKCIA